MTNNPDEFLEFEIIPSKGCPLKFKKGTGCWVLEYCPLYGVGISKDYNIVLEAITGLFPDVKKELQKSLRRRKKFNLLAKNTKHPFVIGDKLIIKHHPHVSWEAIRGGEFTQYEKDRIDFTEIVAIITKDDARIPILRLKTIMSTTLDSPIIQQSIIDDINELKEYKIRIFNNDINSFEEVANILSQTLNINYTKAMEYAVLVDKAGLADVYYGRENDCHEKAKKIHSIGIVTEVLPSDIS